MVVIMPSYFLKMGKPKIIQMYAVFPLYTFNFFIFTNFRGKAQFKLYVIEFDDICFPLKDIEYRNRYRMM